MCVALENGHDGTMWDPPLGSYRVSKCGAEKPGEGQSINGTQGLADRAAHGTSSGHGEPLQVFFRRESVLMEVMIIMMVLIIACSSVFL